MVAVKWRLTNHSQAPIFNLFVWVDEWHDDTHWAEVHYGTADQIRRHRQNTLNATYTQHPDRFIRRPRAPQLPEKAWINQPTTEAQTVSI
jgi:hypothetical protein